MPDRLGVSFANRVLLEQVGLRSPTHIVPWRVERLSTRFACGALALLPMTDQIPSCDGEFGFRARNTANSHAK